MDVAREILFLQWGVGGLLEERNNNGGEVKEVLLVSKAVQLGAV